MKSKATLLGLCVALLALSGCATHKTRIGRQTNLLGGLARVDTGSYQKSNSTTFVPVDLDKIVGRTNPSGAKVSLLWGLITMTDH